MWKKARLLLTDSFKSAKIELSTSFLHHRTISARNIRKEVQRYVFQLPKGALYNSSPVGFSVSQRSWFRQRLSFLLEEAKNAKNSIAAEEALKCALRLPDVLKFCDFNWLKNAFLSCQTLEEWDTLKKALLTAHCKVPHLSPTFSSSMVFQDQLLASLQEVERLAVPPVSRYSSRVLSGTSSFVEKESERREKGSDEEEKLSVLKKEECEHSYSSKSTGVFLSRNSLWQSDRSAPNADTPCSLNSSSPVPSSFTNSSRRTRQVAYLPLTTSSATPHPAFSRYFIRQGLVKDEMELMAFFAALRSHPKRLTFRINESSGMGNAVRILLESSPNSGKRGIYPLSGLPPSFGAYSLDCSSSVPYAQLLSHRRLLQHLTHDGLASYQSVSSMLAVFFLQPAREDHILDVCASPGGKTSLILDVTGSGSSAHRFLSSYDHFGSAQHVHSSLQGKDGGENEEAIRDSPQGVLIANDVSSPRVTILEERLQKNCVAFPSLGIMESNFEDWGRKGCRAAQSEGGDFVGLHCFDKVLVDAPCSGESRLGRENGLSPWRLWHPYRGLEFFQKQVALLRKAILCASTSGGRVLYTTCTFNPIENESVVAAVLREFVGKVRLVALPSLKNRKHSSAFRWSEDNDNSSPLVLSPALSHWYVPSRNGLLYATYKEAIRHYPDDVRQFPREAFAFSDEEEEEAGKFRKNKNRSKRMQTKKEGENVSIPSENNYSLSSISSSSFSLTGKGATTQTHTPSLHALVRESIHRHAKRVWPHRNDGEGFFFALLEVSHNEREYVVSNRFSAERKEEVADAVVVAQKRMSTPLNSFCLIKERSESKTWGDYQLLQLNSKIIQRGLIHFFFDRLGDICSLSSSRSKVTTAGMEKMFSLLSSHHQVFLHHRERGEVVIASKAVLQHIPCRCHFSSGWSSKERVSNYSLKGGRLRGVGTPVLRIKFQNSCSSSDRRDLLSVHDLNAKNIYLTDEGAFWLKHQSLHFTSSPFFLDLPLQMVEVLLSQHELSVVFYTLDRSSHGFSSSFSRSPNGMEIGAEESTFYLSLSSTHTAEIARRYPHFRTENDLAQRFKLSSFSQRQKWMSLCEWLAANQSVAQPRVIRGLSGSTNRDVGEKSVIQSAHSSIVAKEGGVCAFNAVVSVASSVFQDASFIDSSLVYANHSGTRANFNSAFLSPVFSEAVRDWVLPVQVRSVGQKKEFVANRTFVAHTVYIQLLSSSFIRNRYIAILGKLRRSLQASSLAQERFQHHDPQVQHPLSQKNISLAELFGNTQNSPYSSSSAH